jgi:hypothetical protein
MYFRPRSPETSLFRSVDRRGYFRDGLVWPYDNEPHRSSASPALFLEFICPKEIPMIPPRGVSINKKRIDLVLGVPYTGIRANPLLKEELCSSLFA